MKIYHFNGSNYLQENEKLTRGVEKKQLYLQEPSRKREEHRYETGTR